MKKTGRHVMAENRLFRVSMTRADEAVYVPKSLKTPATR
jgi:hypothetical protein